MNLPEKHYFLSFNSSDKSWADWVGIFLESCGCKVSNHNWEIGAGGNIISWMNDKLGECDQIISLVSQDYVNAAFSQAEADFGTYESISGQKEKIIPVVVNIPVDIPPLMRSLKRLHIHDLPEFQVREMLLDFLTPPTKPKDPPFPGRV